MQFHVFTVGAENGVGELQYQWKRDEVPLPGATNASYTTPSLRLYHAGTYACEVSDDYASVTSDGAELIVLDTYAAPAAGLAGLGLLTLVTALVGASAVRRRR